MPKSPAPIWDQIVSFGNLLNAFRRAAKGKRSKAEVAGFEFRLEENLLALRDELLQGSYRPGGYRSFLIHDPKKRLISAAPFRDRVVHHALCSVIEPIFERKFIFDSYANRVGKGTHRALNRASHYMRRFTYVLPMDIRQFFPAIDHAILYQTLAGTLQDKHTLELCSRILDSGRGVLTGEYEMVYFPGDDLFAPARPRGLPIGNLTSQFWANVYLNRFDHTVKRHLKCRGYLRYVDDFLLFDDDKARLSEWRQACIEFLAGLRLTIHENSAQPRPCRTGLPFLGFQLFPDHRRVKQRKVIAARRRFICLAAKYRDGEANEEDVRIRVISWINHVRHADSWGLRRAMLQTIPFTRGEKNRGKTIANLQ
jgi:retron-type reverse transcriptase